MTENIKVSTWTEFKLELALDEARKKIKDLAEENQKLQFRVAELEQDEAPDDMDAFIDALLADLEEQPDPDDMFEDRDTRFDFKEDMFCLFGEEMKQLDDLCNKVTNDDEMTKIYRHRVWLEDKINKAVKVKVTFEPATWSYKIYRLSGFEPPVYVPVNDVLTHKVKIDNVLHKLGYNAYME